MPRGRATPRWFLMWILAVLLLVVLSGAYFALVGIVPIHVDQRGEVLEIHNHGPGVRGATFEVQAGKGSYTVPIERLARGVTRIRLADVSPALEGAEVSGTVIRGRRLGVPYEWIAVLRLSPPASDGSGMATGVTPGEP